MSQESNLAGIRKLFAPELAGITSRYGAGAAESVVTSLDAALQVATKGTGGRTFELAPNWPDWQSIEAQLAGQAIAAKRVAEAEADVIRLSPDGLARIVAAARAEPGKVTDIEYDHYGTDGKPIRITQRPTR